jgi:hypothetical protein
MEKKSEGNCFVVLFESLLRIPIPNLMFLLYESMMG